MLEKLLCLHNLNGVELSVGGRLAVDGLSLTTSAPQVRLGGLGGRRDRRQGTPLGRPRRFGSARCTRGLSMSVASGEPAARIRVGQAIDARVQVLTHSLDSLAHLTLDRAVLVEQLVRLGSEAALGQRAGSLDAVAKHMQELAEVRVDALEPQRSALQLLIENNEVVLAFTVSRCQHIVGLVVVLLQVVIECHLVLLQLLSKTG